ncbi:MAG: SpoIID/LytB domain-containing protein [Phycisphaerales bacterium]|nr:MAG: SpoIID/LytB domain-containing protein [Phycisphaerales bacterium]
MPLPSRDKPLLSLTAKKIVNRAVCHTARGYALLATGLIAWAFLLTGCERREIVRPTPQMEAETRFWVRVLLLSDATECTLAASSGLHMSRHESGTPMGADNAMAMEIPTPTRVTVAKGQLCLGSFPQSSHSIVVGTPPPYVFSLNGKDYRGRVRLTINPGGQTFSVINLVPLEPYLAGVVGAEMPSYWEMEALKAQAIAARTYCLYTKDRFGAKRAWDVSSTQTSQVYRGIEAESARIWKAVTSTNGQILTARDGSTGPMKLFPAYFSSICGGHTEDCRHVFGESFGPLQSVPCPYCKDAARLGLFFWPMAQFDRQTVARQLTARYATLEALGEIKDIIVLDKSDYGPFSRMTRIRLVGSTGKTDTLRGEDLRLALDPSGRKIQSTICQIVPWGDGWAFLSGRGWGHGVGLCQYGAEGMARLGRTAETIIQHYYPGSTIENIYE